MSDEGKRLKQRDYLEQGNIPVIDQGEAFVGGYTNDERMAYKGELPVIIFGDHTRRIKLVNQLFAVGADGVKILKPKPFYRPKFFYYFLQSLEIPSRGYSRHFQFLRNFEFVKASPEDQDKVVAEIEKQFSRLDEAVASLKRIQANLKRYKAAVLKVAVEGKLTEQWRKDHPDVEPADQLLKRILAERRAKWEAEELAKMKAKGIKPKDDSWKKKYKEPAGPDTAHPPELPDGWVWTILENVAEVVDPHPSHRTPASVTIGVSYIGMGDITSEGKIDFQKARKIAHEVLIEHKERYSLKLGDFIFGKIGTIGKPVKLCGPFEYALSANVILIQPNPNSTDPDYCFTFMASPLMETVIKKESKATTQAAFGIQKVRLIAYPLPPLHEQEEIRNEVDRRLSVTEELETTIVTNLKRAERLRQTILQQAFSGGLV